MFEHGFPEHWSTLKKLIWIIGAGITGGGEKLVTVKGELVTFIANAVVPIKGLKVDIEPNQAGSGDPSPSNVRTVSGWTGCNIYHTGKNMWNADLYMEGYIISSSTGLPSENSNYNIYKIIIPEGIYLLSKYDNATVSSNTKRVASYDANNEVISGSIVSGGDSGAGRHSLQFTVPNGAKYTLVSLRKTSYNIQLETNTSAPTDYEECIDNIYSFDWSSIAGTIYGGYYDILNGDLMSYVKRTRLSGTSTWYRQQINGQYYFCRSVNSWGIVNEAVACTHFKPMPTASALGSNPDCSIQLAVDRYYQMNVRYDAVTTVSAFQQFLKDNEVYFFYKVSSEATHYDVGATSDYADFGEADSMILTE